MPLKVRGVSVRSVMVGMSSIVVAGLFVSLLISGIVDKIVVVSLV